MSRITVEFFGIPRRRAGRDRLEVEARTVVEALCAVSAQCDGLRDLVGSDGTLSRHYLVSFDGRRFVSDLKEPLSEGARLLLLSADAGG